MRAIAADHNSGFQHTAARRRLPICSGVQPMSFSFNTQPPEGGCNILITDFTGDIVSTHSRPKAAATPTRFLSRSEFVSTHSRPKAAAPAGG